MVKLWTDQLRGWKLNFADLLTSGNARDVERADSARSLHVF